MQKLKLKKEYQKYPEYKNSGVDWIGKIPKEWNVDKLKAGFNFEKGKNAGLFTQEYVGSDKNLGEFPVYSGQTGNNGVMGRINKYVYDFGNDGAIFSTTVGAKVMTPMFLRGKFSLSQNCVLFMNKNKEINNSYFYYQLFPLFKRQKDDIPSHMQPSLRISDLNKYSVVFPIKQDQQKIAKFLDEKVELIDEIVKKKKKLIELLKEKRTAVINSAITKGLDLNVEMKDSGVGWVGDIPKSWNVYKMRFLVIEPFKYGINELSLEDNKEFPRLIRITDVNKYGKLREDKFKSIDPAIAKNYLLKDGDILFARSGATVGKTFQYDSSWGVCCYAGYLIKMSVDKVKTLSDFIYAVTKSSVYENWKNSIFVKATIQNISAEKYKDFIVPIPSIEEQQMITEYINKEAKEIDVIWKKVEKSINLLNEFKSSLISSVVTGKVKI